MIGALSIGVVIGALVAALVTSMLVGDGGEGDEPDTDPIELPDRLGDLVSTATAERDGEPFPADVRERAERRNALAVEVVGDAYGGASAAAQDYWSEDLETRTLVLAVRAESPEPFVPELFVEPADLGLEVRARERLYVDDIACIVVNPYTAEGDEVDRSRVFVGQCQRSRDGVTVIVQPNGVSDLTVAASILDDAWDAIEEG